MVIEMLKIGTFDTNLGKVLSNDHRVLLDLEMIEGDGEYGYSNYNYKYNPIYRVKDLLDIQFTSTDLLEDLDTVKLLDRYGVLDTDSYGIVEDYKKHLKDDIFKHLDYKLNASDDIADNTDLYFTELLVLSYLANKSLTQNIDIIVYRKDDEEDDYYSKDYGRLIITYDKDTKICKATIEYYDYSHKDNEANEDDNEDYEYSKNNTVMVSVSITEELIKELIGTKDTSDRNLKFLEYVNDKIKDNDIRLLCKD